MLEEIAESKGIKIKEPYVGSKIGDCFTILSPTRDWHLFELIPSSKKTDVIVAMEDDSQITTSFLPQISETIQIETLKDYEETSRENESSVILYGNLGHGGILFTGDAGKEALNKACQYAQEKEFNIADNLSFVQVPHHGSKRNIEPIILNRIVGKISINKRNTVAYVSSGKNDKKHPAKIVVNAFIRRGCKVIATQGSTKCHHRGKTPTRNWSTAKPLEFSNKVESYD